MQYRLINFLHKINTTTHQGFQLHSRKRMELLVEQYSRSVSCCRPIQDDLCALTWRREAPLEESSMRRRQQAVRVQQAAVKWPATYLSSSGSGERERASQQPPLFLKRKCSVRLVMSSRNVGWSKTSGNQKKYGHCLRTGGRFEICMFTESCFLWSEIWPMASEMALVKYTKFIRWQYSDKHLVLVRHDHIFQDRAITRFVLREKRVVMQPRATESSATHTILFSYKHRFDHQTRLTPALQQGPDVARQSRSRLASCNTHFLQE
jgi:hypothetical protein